MVRRTRAMTPLGAAAAPQGRREGRTMHVDWDAIVVGGSFGGLAAAMELAGAGRVLVIDREPIGAGETSACGTLLGVLERLEALEALEQVHEEIVLHFEGGRSRRVGTRYPFATFDYRALCQLLFGRTDATFVQASVTGMGDGEVSTTLGPLRARLLIDASGWRSALGGAARPDLVPADALGLGIELRAPVVGDGLHFWVRPSQMPCGVTWQFPAGTSSRVGIACYRGRGGLKAPLDDFLDKEAFPDSTPPPKVHGGLIPSRLRDPVAGPVLLVGDAAGQCLPLTAEGIRPALVFGQIAGRLARQALDGVLTLEQVREQYRREVRARRHQYRLLEGMQAMLLRSPQRVLPMFAWLFGKSPLTGPAQRAYWELADPGLLQPGHDLAEAPARIGAAEVPEGRN